MEKDETAPMSYCILDRNEAMYGKPQKNDSGEKKDPPKQEPLKPEPPKSEASKGSTDINSKLRSVLQGLAD